MSASDWNRHYQPSSNISQLYIPLMRKKQGTCDFLLMENDGSQFPSQIELDTRALTENRGMQTIMNKNCIDNSISLLYSVWRHRGRKLSNDKPGCKSFGSKSSN